MQNFETERNTSRVNRGFRLKRTENMIYSPQQGIPLGEAVILPNGTHGIRFKRKRKNGEVTETAHTASGSNGSEKTAKSQK